MQHRPAIAQACHALAVEQMSIDARDLRRRVGAQAQEPPRQRIDDLERAGEGQGQSSDDRGEFVPEVVTVEQVKLGKPRKLFEDGLQIDVIRGTVISAR